MKENNNCQIHTTTRVDSCQEGGAKNNPLFVEIVELLRNSIGVNRQKVLNLIQKISSQETGKAVVLLIPYLQLKRHSYREIASKVGYSSEQIRKWVYQFAPEIFAERSKIHGPKKNDQ